jgi:hypothetical protein
MIIRDLDGRNREAVLLSRTVNSMRVVMEGDEETTHLTQVNGTWFGEDCEPVRVEFAWQSLSRTATPPVSDCVCPAELGAKLVELLQADGSDEQSEVPPLHFGAGSTIL